MAGPSSSSVFSFYFQSKIGNNICVEVNVTITWFHSANELLIYLVWNLGHSRENTMYIEQNEQQWEAIFQASSIDAKPGQDQGPDTGQIHKENHPVRKTCATSCCCCDHSCQTRSRCAFIHHKPQNSPNGTLLKVIFQALCLKNYQLHHVVSKSICAWARTILST